MIATQEEAGIDVVCDGELYRFDINHPETNGMMGEDFFLELSRCIQINDLLRRTFQIGTTP